MHIVVNSIYLHGSQPENASFIEELFEHLCTKYSEHHFYFLVNQSTNHHYPAAANATIIPVEYTVKNFASLKIWESIKLPFILKKLQATVLLQPFGLCSITTKVPQVLFVSDLFWLHQPQLLPASIRLYHRLFGKKGIHKATQMITFSQSIQQQLISQYPNISNKITTIGGAVSALFQPASYEQKQQTKDGYADGRNYFLFVGGNNPSKNLVGVLKAFSSFKRWQKSNMKLLIAGTMTPQKDDVLKKIGSYKYKDDVVVLQVLAPEQLASITAAAFAVIAPYLYEETALYMLAVMQSGVPVVASNFPAMEELGGEACLYASPNEVDEIANHLKQLYRDEQLQASLKAKGLEQAAKYNWERTTNAFWEVLVQATTS